MTPKKKKEKTVGEFKVWSLLTEWTDLDQGRDDTGVTMVSEKSLRFKFNLTGSTVSINYISLPKPQSLNLCTRTPLPF